MTDQIIMFISQLFNGLKIGSVYALVALGYTMVYGIIRLINFAHGDFIMVGATCSCSPFRPSWPWDCRLGGGHSRHPGMRGRRRDRRKGAYKPVREKGNSMTA